MTLPPKRIFDAVAEAITGPSLMIGAVADSTNICRPSVQRVINCLHDNGIVHIADWRKIRNGSATKSVPMYTFGPGVDAVKPLNQTREERLAAKRAYREALKSRRKVDVIHREHLAEELARPAFRDPFIAQFFGPYEARA